MHTQVGQPDTTEWVVYSTVTCVSLLRLAGLVTHRHANPVVYVARNAP